MLAKEPASLWSYIQPGSTHVWEVGHQVQYFSGKQQAWRPTEITSVYGDGTANLLITKGVLLKGLLVSSGPTEPGPSNMQFHAGADAFVPEDSDQSGVGAYLRTLMGRFNSFMQLHHQPHIA